MADPAQRAVDARPTSAADWHRRGIEYADEGKLDQAITAFRRALRIDDSLAEIHNDLGTALFEKRWYAEAEGSFRRAIELKPDHGVAYANLGAVLRAQGRLQEGRREYQRALLMKVRGLLPRFLRWKVGTRPAPGNPHHPINLAILLKDDGRLDEARAIYHARQQSVPDDALAMLNMGTLAIECDADLDAARAWYAKGLALEAHAIITLSDSIVDLLDGNYAVAWGKYEARKEVSNHRKRHAHFAQFRPWEGETLAAGRLLVYGEQGLGDEVMFASMIGEVASMAAHLTLLCDARLETLFRRSFPGVEVVPMQAGTVPMIVNAPDRVIASGSLGLHLRKKGADFPQHQGYLKPDAQKTAAWRERLAALGPGKKVGFSWTGGVPGTGRARRSLALEQLRPLMALPGIVPVSLQYGDCAAEIAEFSRESGIAVHAFPGVTDDMDEFASLIQALDAVVSVCNTTVHVAGAIGKEVLVMAPRVPEWRYGMRGEKMAWYPSARVFRQPAFGAWDDVISAVKAKLSGA